MNFSPLPQQRIMIDAMTSRPINALFADPGLGKTGSVLAAMDHLLTSGASKGALIVAPKRVATMTWPDELEKWTNFSWMRMANLRTPEGILAWERGSADLYVINYDMLPKFIPNYLASKKVPPVDTVVWDEISKMKSGGKWCKAFTPHYLKFERHVGLTGTPAPNSYLDLFHQIKTLDGGARLGRSMAQFKSRFFDSDYMGWTHTIKPHGKAAIEKLIGDITTVLSAADYLHIPPTDVEDVDIELSSEVTKHYRTMERQLLLELKDVTIVSVNAAVLTGKLLQITSGAVYDDDRVVTYFHWQKIEALKKLSAKLKKPLLVATSFIHERDRIVQRVPGAEVFREDRLDAWNAGKIPVWVADPRSVGHGLNLQAGGDTVVWFTPTYSRELYDQMNARLARHGQENRTTVIRLIAKNTIDEAVVETLRNKGDQQSGLKTALKNLQRLRTT